MIKYSIFVFAYILFAGIQAVSGQIVSQCDFETGAYCANYQDVPESSSKAGSIDGTSQVLGTYSRYGQITTAEALAQTNLERTEFDIQGWTSAFGGLGVTRWYGFAFKPIAGWADPTAGASAPNSLGATIFFQNKLRADACDGTQSPAISLSIINDNNSLNPRGLRIINQYDANACTSGTQTSVSQDLPESNIPKGVTSYFVVEWKPAIDNTGVFRVWRNGVQIYTRTNAPTSQNNDASPPNTAVRMGLYKGWLEPNTPPAGLFLGAWHDQIKIGGPSSSFADVNPQPPPNISSATIEAANASVLIVTIANPYPGPMLPASGVTGLSAVCSVTSGASTVSRVSDNVYHITRTSTAFQASDNCTVVYTPGNIVTTSTAVPLQAEAGFPVENNLLAPSATVRQSSYGCLQPNTALGRRVWTSTPYINTPCNHPSVSPVNIVVSLRVEAGTLTTIPRLWCNDGLGYYRVEDEFGANGYKLTTDAVIPHATQRQQTPDFALSGTFVGVASRHHAAPSSSYPPVSVSFSATPVGVKQFEMGFSLATNKSIGTETICQVRYEDGTQFTTYDNNVVIRVGRPIILGYGGGL